MAVREAGTGAVLFQRTPEETLRAASIGKLLLLIHVAHRITRGLLDPAEQLTRSPVDAVADSGIWQHLGVETMQLTDLCTLIGTASDNLATNVLLRRVGLAAVIRTGSELGLHSTELLDQVRDERGSEHPWTLSTGCAAELADLMYRLATGSVFEPATSATVLGWLGNGLDLSMVAAGWGLDPLAHAGPDRGIWLHHKTGTDDGVRCDVGLLTGPRRRVAYAVLANWDPARGDHRDAVLATMRDLGLQLRRVVG